MNVQETIDLVVDHVRGMWRFRWHASVITWCLALFGWYLVFAMPNVYEASARVSVDTNSLLPTLTEGLTASENVMSEVDLVRQALLTRGNIESVAEATGIIQRAKTANERELLITGLQRRIRVTDGRDKIFNISFDDTNRLEARKFVAHLLETFVESSLGAQDDDADMTERAIAMEIEDHERRLQSAESDLAQFKKENIGYMPDDGRDYYSRLQSALSEVRQTQRQIAQLKEKRSEIARQIEGEEPVFGLMPATQAEVNASCSQSAAISGMKSELAALLVDYTDKHPRVTKLRDSIGGLEEQCKAELATTPGTRSMRSANSLDKNPVYQNLRMQLSTADVDLVALGEKLASSQRQVTELRADVDKIAQVETDLKRLNRDYSVIESRHQELLKRWETLQSKKRLDPVTDQLQFVVLEPPFAPARPVAPNRQVYIGVVLIFSLGAGLAVTFALNMLKPVFFRRQAVHGLTGLPVLGTVSMVLSSAANAKRKRLAFVWAATVGTLLLATVACVVFETQAVEAVSMLASGSVQ